MADTQDTSSEWSNNVYQIGQQHYVVEIWMYNFIDKPFEVDFFIVDQLVIEELLDDWNVRGFLTLANPLEMLERGTPQTKDTEALPAPFLFRTDGRNKISVRMFPYVKGSSETELYTQDSQESPGKDPTQEICYDFSIYDIQDVSSEVPGFNKRTFYFKDEKHQILSERNLEWSTSTGSADTAADKDRTMNGNAAIKALLQAASKIEGGDDDVIKVGYGKDGTIDKPTIPLNQIDENNWDRGPEDDDARLFYTSPAKAKVIHDINYILKHTKATDGSPVILQYGRTPRESSNPGWKLTPLSTIFKTPSQDTVEDLTIVDNVDASGSTPPVPRIPQEKFASGISSIITSYHYAPPVAADDNFFVNKPVFNYNFASGTYTANYKDNTVQATIKALEKIAQPLYNMKGGQGQIAQCFNNTKVKGMSTEIIYVPQIFHLKDCSSLKMLKDIIFLSGMIYIQLPGLTQRTPGKFITINRPVYSENRFDDKFLGEWLITKVTHTITKTAYINDIAAVKFDAKTKIFPENDPAY
jgi:hypothetical protein